jgi:hypothetical protein
MVISGTYNVPVSFNWRQSQTRREDLFCNTSTAPVIINLPLISDILDINASGVLMNVVDLANNSDVNNITINASGSDTIDGFGSSSVVLSIRGASIVLGISSEGKWIALESNFNTQVPSSNSYGLFTQIEDGPIIINTTDQLSLLGNGVGTLSVPANQFVRGDTFQANMGGIKSNQNNNEIEFSIKVDGIIILQSGFISLGGSTNKNWELITEFTIREIGGPGVASIHVNSKFLTERDGGQEFEGTIFDTTNSTEFDTTKLNTLNILAQWNIASPNNSINSDQFILYKLF